MKTACIKGETNRLYLPWPKHHESSKQIRKTVQAWKPVLSVVVTSSWEFHFHMTINANLMLSVSTFTAHLNYSRHEKDLIIPNIQYWTRKTLKTSSIFTVTSIRLASKHSHFTGCCPPQRHILKRRLNSRANDLKELIHFDQTKHQTRQPQNPIQKLLSFERPTKQITQSSVASHSVLADVYWWSMIVSVQI